MIGWCFYILDKVLLAVIVGLVANVIFFIILSRFKPKIEISPEIAKGRCTITGKTIYRIKVINRCSYAIMDIRSYLHIYKNYPSTTGEVWKSESIDLQRSDPLIIDKYSKNDDDANYAYRFLTYDDIEEKWKDDNSQFLRFRIFARHSASGFGAFFFKDYKLKENSIVEGDFSKGDTFKIVQVT